MKKPGTARRHTLVITVADSDRRFLQSVAEAYAFAGRVRGRRRSGPISWRSFAGWFFAELLDRERASFAPDGAEYAPFPGAPYPNDRRVPLSPARIHKARLAGKKDTDR